MRYTKHITIPREALHRARAVLEAAGYVVESAPPDLLEQGVILTAWHPEHEEGYLLSAEEIRLLALHRTISVLDPEHQDARPRWQRPTPRDRERAYVEAALARAIGEMQAAAPGTRNITLNRLAFGLAGLEHLGLDRTRAVRELVAVAVALGLPESEAESTARRGWAKGAQHPRDLPPSSPFFAKGLAENQTRWESRKSDLPPTKHTQPWGAGKKSKGGW